MRVPSRRTFVSGVVAFFSMLVLGVVAPSATTAAGMGYLWYQSSAIFGSVSASRYRTQIQAAAADYDATRLTIGHTTNLVGGESYIIFYEGNYGASEWVGRATAYNRYNEACSDTTGRITGACTTTDRRAVRATIHIDLADQSWLNTGANAKYVMEHETGHVFGMGHLECYEASVMVEGSCPTRYSSLQPTDKTFINNHY